MTHPVPPATAVGRRGYSLVEVVVVITVISILVVISVPTFGRAVEQSQADIAAANLRAVWSAERLYWLENHAYTTDLTALQSSGLLDPAVVTATGVYVYEVQSAGGSTFTATATRTGSQRWSGSFTIDDTGAFAGALQAPGQAAIVPGFQ